MTSNAAGLLFAAAASIILIMIPLLATGHWKGEKVEDKTDECKWGRKNYVNLPSGKTLAIVSGTGKSGTSDCHLSAIQIITDNTYWKWGWSADAHDVVQNIDPASCTSTMCMEFTALSKTQRLQYCRNMCDCDKSCIGYAYYDLSTKSTCVISKTDVWHSSCIVLPTSLVTSTDAQPYATNLVAATVGPIPPTLA